ncbi:hypothetical protein [Paenibacillus sp. FSL R7-0652]|uniref:Uncharacterized protein n=1 Tax=Paenibacillus sp. AN1007 TaxID=3151385 RepID=A0AAU8NBE1_9BACL
MAIQHEWIAVSSKAAGGAGRSVGSGNARKKRSVRLYHRISTPEGFDPRNSGVTAIQRAFRDRSAYPSTNAALRTSIRF